MSDAAGNDGLSGDRLGFEEIVPGTGGSEGYDPEIPQFDLNQQLLADRRRQVASRRRGPGRRAAEASPDQRTVAGSSRQTGLLPLGESGGDPIIRDIVRRDIARLCAGETVFGP